MNNDHHLPNLTAHKYVLYIIIIIKSKPKLVNVNVVTVRKIVSLVLTSFMSLLHHPILAPSPRS